jgi:tRNA A-37 threonylcarbamoyl transferase component Bud32
VASLSVVVARGASPNRRHERPTNQPVAPKIDIGSTIAAYTVTELIADDGMGIVYRGEHKTTAAVVALKILSPTLAGDETSRRRFLNEARYTSALNHPNIVNVYDAGEVKKLLYIAMQYVRGHDLKHILAEEGPLDPQRALDLLSQVAAALDAAHAAGIVHRDVKPSNVMVASGEGGQPAGHVYVTDFGLGRQIAEPDALTQPGTFVGNALYSAPEQLSGGALDHRADVYAVGCMLFECLVGELPFVRERALEVMHAHLQEPPPTVSDRRSGLPTTLDGVIATAMAKDPDQRYSSCAAVIDAARAALGAPRPASPVAPAEPPSAPTPAAVEAGELVLEVTGGDATGTRIAVDAEVVLGRDAGGPGTLGGDSELSRRHARVFRNAGGGYEIEDLGSSNGTRLNDRPVTGPVALALADTIQAGTTVLVVRELPTSVAEPIPSPASPVAPPRPAPTAPIPDPPPPSPQPATPSEPPTPPAPPTPVIAPDAAPLGSPTRLTLKLEIDLAVDLDAHEVTLRLGDEARVISLDGALWRLVPADDADRDSGPPDKLA